MAKKLESNLKNMALSLFIICGIMSAALGYVYSLTKGPIEKAENEKINNAIRLVVPEFDNQPGADAFFIPQVNDKDNTDTTMLKCFPATKDGKLVGTAVQTYTNKGFNGYISLMVGFLPDGTIYNVSVMNQKETPGLGVKMKEDKFKNQFNGKNPATFKLMVKKDGGDVDAITAATISSRAACDALQRAYKAFINKQAVKNTTDSQPDSIHTEGGIK